MLAADCPAELKLSPRADGFRVEAEGLDTVEVTLRPTGFSVQRVEGTLKKYRLFSECGFGCNYDCGCRPQCDRPVIRNDDDDVEEPCRGDCDWCFDITSPELWFPYLGPSLIGARNVPWNVAWVMAGPEATPESKLLQTISKKLRSPIAEQTERMLTKANPTILGVQKAAFRAVFGVDTLFTDRRLYEHQYLVKDLLTYRAAAAVVAVTPQVVLRRGELEKTRERPNDLQELVLSRAQNWQGVLSPSGQAYRSLSRTLMELPGRIPPYLLPALAEIELERPITDRVELIALLEASEHYESLRLSEPQHAEQPVVLPQATNVRLFLHATRGELCDAMQSIARTLGCILSPRRAEDIGRMARYLMAYPEPHRGKIAGLTRRSIAWHLAGAHDHRKLQQDQDYLKTPTMLPPIDLPTNPCLTFLGTVGDIYREGGRMQHCVAHLANKAVAGECYLFHCEYRRQRATIEVHRSGRVVEAGGPFNQQNLASDYGEKKLADWGKTVPTAPACRRTA